MQEHAGGLFRDSLLSDPTDGTNIERLLRGVIGRRSAVCVWFQCVLFGQKLSSETCHFAV